MTQVLSVALSVAAVFLLVRLLSTPLRWFWKLCINTLCGAVLLGLVNLLAPLTGLYIAVTAPAACIVGFFGLPGFAARRADAAVSVSRAGAASRPTAAAAGAASHRIHAF